MTRIVVTSASGANGDGYGALLCFSHDGDLAGPFSDDTRITDPRGLSLSPGGDLIYVTSGDDRVLALNRSGKVVLRGTILALPSGLDTKGEPLLPNGVVPFPRGFGTFRLGSSSG
jgi:hypothetical protein